LFEAENDDGCAAGLDDAGSYEEAPVAGDGVCTALAVTCKPARTSICRRPWSKAAAAPTHRQHARDFQRSGSDLGSCRFRTGLQRAFSSYGATGGAAEFL